LTGTCVPGGQISDASIDAPLAVGCPAGYAAVSGSVHRYKAIPSTVWSNAAGDCKLTSSSAYLAVPDDATELTNLATVAAATPFWVGLDDQDHNNIFMTQKGGAAATFLPWVTNPPDRGPPLKDCVMAISATQINTDLCGNSHIAVCECEP
jgi:hypothetical protein